MNYDAFGVSFVREKIKELPYIKDYHIQKVDSDKTRSVSTIVSQKIKIRLWVVQNRYLMEILSGQPKIEDVLREMQKVQPLVYDIFYV